MALYRYELKNEKEIDLANPLTINNLIQDNEELKGLNDISNLFLHGYIYKPFKKEELLEDSEKTKIIKLIRKSTFIPFEYFQQYSMKCILEVEQNTCDISFSNGYIVKTGDDVSDNVRNSKSGFIYQYLENQRYDFYSHSKLEIKELKLYSDKKTASTKLKVNIVEIEEENSNYGIVLLDSYFNKSYEIDSKESIRLGYDVLTRDTFIRAGSKIFMGNSKYLCKNPNTNLMSTVIKIR